MRSCISSRDPHQADLRRSVVQPGAAIGLPLGPPAVTNNIGHSASLRRVGLLGRISRVAIPRVGRAPMVYAPLCAGPGFSKHGVPSSDGDQRLLRSRHYMGLAEAEPSLLDTLAAVVDKDRWSKRAGMPLFSLPAQPTGLKLRRRKSCGIGQRRADLRREGAIRGQSPRKLRALWRGRAGCRYSGCAHGQRRRHCRVLEHWHAD